MKVDNPRLNDGGEVFCEDCPLADKAGISVGGLCFAYGDDCPTAATYADAVAFADKNSQ